MLSSEYTPSAPEQNFCLFNTRKAIIKGCTGRDKELLLHNGMCQCGFLNIRNNNALKFNNNNAENK